MGVVWTILACAQLAHGAELAPGLKHLPPGPVQAVLYLSPAGQDAIDRGTLERPLRTLTAAQGRVRALKASGQTGHIVVVLRGGRYFLPETFQLTAADSGRDGTRKVIYRSFDLSEPASLSGGRRLTGLSWEHWRSGIYRTRVPADLPSFRELYVDGARATRARHPNTNGTPTSGFEKLLFWSQHVGNAVNQYVGIPRHIQGKDVYAAFEATVPRCKGGLAPYTPMEAVIHRQWSQSRFRIQAVQSGTYGGKPHVTLHFCDEEKIAAAARLHPISMQSQPFYLENLREFVDAPAEWFHDRLNGWLYYQPREGSILQESTFIVPVLERIVSIAGTGTGTLRAHNIVFEGLILEHSAFERDPNAMGFIEIQAAEYAAPTAPLRRDPPAALDVRYAHSILIRKNSFRNVGATAIQLHSAVSVSSVLQNTIVGAGGSAIALGLDSGAIHTNPLLAVGPAVTLRENQISTSGAHLQGSVGILARWVHDVRILRNVLKNLPYTGISVGWGWGYYNQPFPLGPRHKVLRDNLVERNEIFGACKTLYDCGGIYTLGRQPGSIIRENLVYGLIISGLDPQVGALARGIYLDQGSQEILLEDNRIRHLYPKPEVEAIIENKVSTPCSVSEIECVRSNVFRGNLRSNDTREPPHWIPVEP